ncbi:unnamed protein product [Cuscuta campestris]|uniref:CCHC-type domain-containing protein n=1 Tax=Cuscuta campestris TaxID=132261 RepID=A0A484NK68_9ASTE|nr:unnamed protein product [Cuscuta campestris]
MLCFPLFTDQPANRRLVVEDWKVGINLCDGKAVEREEVRGKAKRLMSRGATRERFGENVKVPIPKDKLTIDDKKKLSLSAKALNILFCALGPDEFARVSSCKSAKEAWKLLEATNEGDKDTKATKIALGTSEYENFKMKAGESVQDMNKQFNLIVNNLSKLNKVHPTSEINTKIIFSLPREWHSLVVNLLPKCADVETSTIWSSLYSHELLLKKMKGEEQVPVIKKTMALKIDDHPESEGESDEELAMFKRYKKFMKWNKGESSKKFPPKKGKSNQITCYECGNIGHIKPECPNLKKKEELRKGKKKALKVTWDDLKSDESDSDQSQEENANACFMASNDEEEKVGKKRVLKPEEEYTDDDFKKVEQNAKALHLVYCAMNVEVFQTFSGYTSAKKLWDDIQEKYEALEEAIEEPHTCFIANEEEEENAGGGTWLKLVMSVRTKPGIHKTTKRTKVLIFDKHNLFKSRSKCYNDKHEDLKCLSLKYSRRPNVQDLPTNRFILLKILKENVILVLNKDKQVGVYECTLLYWLFTHKKINLPSIILKHMHECSNRLNKPYCMLHTHMFAKREILEVRPSRVRYLDAECLGYCGLVKIGEEYYMKKEFQNLDEATRAEYGPRRSMSSLPSTSRAPRAVDEENANTEVPVRAPRVKRSKSASHASSASLMHRHSHMASTSKNPFKKFKKFILTKLKESLDDLSDRMKKMEDRENRQKQNEDRASRRR